MSQQLYIIITVVIFLVISVMHIFRLVLGWKATLNNSPVPIWLSWVAIPIFGFLTYQGLRYLL